MDERTLRVLEYDAIKAGLLRQVASQLGRELVEGMRPAVSRERVELLLEETSQAWELLEAHRTAPLGGLHDIRPAVLGAAKGVALEPDQLLEVASTLAASRRMQRFVPAGAARLRIHADQLAAFPEIEQAIDLAIDSRGQVTDSASPELARIRQRIRSLQNAISERLEAMVRSPETARMLQEPIVTIRDGRYCLPVRSDHKGEFQGVVHDTSASGATLFMEPLAATQMNNELRESEGQQREEVRRVLAHLSRLVGDRAEAIRESLAGLAALDFIFARARLAGEMDGCRPETNQQGVIELRQARHPLLAGEVVPVDISLGDGFTTLVITGPNTGGKTVALKTLGLLTLMLQSGLHPPVAAGSRMAVFRQVFADIGDEQSLQQSLSTFSSHMNQIVKVMEAAGADSLVLLDEIGAGTDPAEGSALAKAILAELHRRGARTAATTHYGELKSFAYTQPGMMNASVEFDPQTLRPTFRMMTGLPGSSNAFLVAARLGLPAQVLAEARSQIGETQAALDAALRQVEQARQSMEQERLAAIQARLEMERARERHQALLDELKKTRADLIRQYHQQASEVLRRARLAAEELLDEMKETAKQGAGRLPAARRQARSRLAELEQQVEQAAPEEQVSEAPPPALASVRPGDRVMVRSVRSQGTVISGPDEQGQLELQVGILRIKTGLSDLVPLPAPVAVAPEVVERIQREKAALPPEIHLRGMRVEEAMSALEKYLDDALLAGLPRVRIIHGIGTGAVRRAALDLLRNHPGIKSWRAGHPDEGGAGVTVAELEG